MPSKTQLAVGLDAGSSRTRCIICALEGDHIRYLAHGLAPSAGGPRDASPIRRRWPNRFARRWPMPSAAPRFRWRASRSGVGGVGICGAQSRGLYEFGRPREVDADDMAYAVKLASEVRLERDRMLLHVLPQDFTLDGRAGYRKPHKGVCSRLEANVHIVTGVVPGASGRGRRDAPGAASRWKKPCSSRWPPPTPASSRKNARAAWRCSIWGCIRPTWWSTTATRCCWPPASRCGPII